MSHAAFVRVAVLIGLLTLKTRKNLLTQLSALMGFFFVAGGVGLFVTQSAGQIAPRGWAFYAIAGALFTSFAFPRFAWRCLVMHPT